jgi:hypothetical protein
MGEPKSNLIYAEDQEELSHLARPRTTKDVVQLTLQATDYRYPQDDQCALQTVLISHAASCTMPALPAWEADQLPWSHF